MGWPSGAAAVKPTRQIMNLPARALFRFSGHFAIRNSVRTPSAAMSLRTSSAYCRFTCAGSLDNSSVSGCTSRLVSPAVAVAVDVAIHVEQRLRSRQVVLPIFAAKFGIEADGVRHDGRLCRNRLILSRKSNFLLRIGRQVDRTTQRDPFRGVATDNRIVHVVHIHRQIRGKHAIQLNALSLQVRRELAVRSSGVDELVSDAFEKVLLPVQERQPAWLLFFDDGYLDTIDHRQPPTAEASAAEPGLPRRPGSARRRKSALDR